MPLAPGSSRGIIAGNIREMMHAGYPQRQAVAASLSNARRHPHSSGGIARRAPGGGIGGIAPPQMNASPFMQSMMQQYAQMPEEKLQEMAVRFGNSPQGQVAQRLLMQRRMMPQAQPMTPVSPQTQAGIAPQMDQPMQSSGAGIARGGPVRRDIGGGLSLGEMNPWWTRTAAREDEDYAGSRGVATSAAREVDSMYDTGPGGKPLPRTAHGHGPPEPPRAPSWMEPWEQDPNQGASQFASMAKNLAGAFPSSGGIAQPVGDQISAMEPSGFTLDPSDLDLSLPNIAKGGSVQHTAGRVPVLLSGGEFVFSPHDVARIGGGEYTGPNNGGISGLVKSASAGRTDQVRTEAPADAYVIPADVVSGLGQGNSLAGAHILERIRSSLGGRPLARKPIPPKVALKHGHAVLDKWVVAQRKKIVGTMKALKPPVHSRAKS